MPLLHCKRRFAAAPAAMLTALAVAGVGPATATATAAAKERCAAKGSRTEVASRAARVYSVRRVRDGEATRRWYGCAYAAGRRVHLGDVGPAGEFSDRISPVRLAGRHVAFVSEYTASTGDALGAVVAVRDLRTGAFVRRFASPGDPNTYDVTDLELRANGSVAWIARIVAGMPATTTYEVRVFPTTDSHSTIVDSGTSIASRSLALSSTTLYWTHDRVARSTALK